MTGVKDVHATALVASGARLGSGVRIGPYAVVETETEIGDGCELRAHATVKRFTTLGASNTVHEHAVLGGEPQDLAFRDAPSALRIGDGNRIREGVSIHRGSRPGSVTVVGSECFLMVGVHVAHDNVIGDRAILANNVMLAGHVEIGAGAFLGGGAGVHQFCRVGRLAMVGGNAKVVQDCLPFVITDGAPARARGLNVVGLRRAGFGPERIRTLREAYRRLLRSGLSLADALDTLAGMQDPDVDELVAFVRGSKRGFAHAARSQSD